MKDAIDVKVQESKQWFKVYEFMRRDLELKSPELYVYAYIHQFCAVNVTKEEIANVLGINIKTVEKALKELESKRLIVKHKVNIAGNCTRNIYAVRFRYTGELTREQILENIETRKIQLMQYYEYVKKKFFGDSLEKSSPRTEPQKRGTE